MRSPKLNDGIAHQNNSYCFLKYFEPNGKSDGAASEKKSVGAYVNKSNDNKTPKYFGEKNPANESGLSPNPGGRWRRQIPYAAQHNGLPMFIFYNRNRFFV
jgi:hypothetical protein